MEAGLYYTLAALLVALDQVTKHFARVTLAAEGSRVLLPGVVGLTYVENTGMAFSSFSGATGVLAVVSAAAAAALAVAIYHRALPRRFSQLMLTLLLAGAVGNLIDRSIVGYVTDMIQLLFVRFAVFNVADICVTVGAFGLIFDLFFFESEGKR